MSIKKDKILAIALELFANLGFDATSTSKIAKLSGVSEGLIFRHFGNKQGLLEAIMLEAEQKSQQVFAHIFFETNPKEVIKKLIALPFALPKKDHDYWRLQYKLKWEQGYNNPRKMQPILEKVAWAFQALEYDNPKLEAQFIVQNLDAVAISILRNELEEPEVYRAFLFRKYGLEV